MSCTWKGWKSEDRRDLVRNDTRENNNSLLSKGITLRGEEVHACA